MAETTHSAGVVEGTILTPPAGAAITHTPTSIYWFDGDGILCSITKKAPAPTLEQTKHQLEEFNKIARGRKFCMLLDVTHTVPSAKAVREYAAVELPKLVLAMAMISASPMGRMLANLFFAIKPPSYPCKMFSTENQAKEWLQQYLTTDSE